MQLSKRVIEPGIVVLEVGGDMRMGVDCQRLTQTSEELVREGQRRVVLDLSALKLIDSAGVGAIVACFSHMKKAGGMLRVAGSRGMVDTVLRLTQVHRAIEFFPAAADAARDFPAGAAPRTPGD